MCILSFGVCSVFEFLAYEGMNGTTNLAVVDLSPYGIVFQDFSLPASVLNEFLNCLFFVYFGSNRFAQSGIYFVYILHTRYLWGDTPEY